MILLTFFIMEFGAGVFWAYVFRAVALAVAIYALITLIRKLHARGWGMRRVCARCGADLSGTDDRCRVCGHRIGEK